MDSSFSIWYNCVTISDRGASFYCHVESTFCYQINQLNPEALIFVVVMSCIIFVDPHAKNTLFQSLLKKSQQVVTFLQRIWFTSQHPAKQGTYHRPKTYHSQTATRQRCLQGLQKRHILHDHFISYKKRSINYSLTSKVNLHSSHAWIRPKSSRPVMKLYPSKVLNSKPTTQKVRHKVLAKNIRISSGNMNGFN